MIIDLTKIYNINEFEKLFTYCPICNGYMDWFEYCRDCELAVYHEWDGKINIFFYIFGDDEGLSIKYNNCRLWKNAEIIREFELDYIKIDFDELKSIADKYKTLI
jgi:hypothetical protein